MAFARAFTGTSWAQSSGDLVAKRQTTASVDGIDIVLDINRFRKRVEELASAKKLDPEASAVVTTFLDAWKRREKGRDDD